MTFEEFREEAREGRKLSLLVVAQNGIIVNIDDAEIHIEDGSDIYILQNVICGLNCRDKKGYKRSLLIDKNYFTQYIKNIQWIDEIPTGNFYVDISWDQFLSICDTLQQQGYLWLDGCAPNQYPFGKDEILRVENKTLSTWHRLGKRFITPIKSFEQFKKYLNILKNHEQK